MSIGKTVKDILIPLGAPVSRSNYNDSEATYITYFCYNEQGEEWAENVEIATGYYVQVDVWSDTDYVPLVAQVQAAMIAAGFIRTTAQDLYEPDTKTYHKALRFSYIN